MQNLILKTSRLFLIASVFALLLPNVGGSEEYGLKVGTKAPQIRMKDVDGKWFDLKKTLMKQPVVLLFYRGGWCRYCNAQLRSVQQELMPKLKKHGATLVAISVDRLSEAEKSYNEHKLDFIVISDPKATTLGAYNVKYKVPEATVSKYKNEYKLDLEAKSGETHHIIAKPAVFVIKQDGRVGYSYTNEDITVRAKHDDIVAVVKALNNS